jgi:hypothetical protein
VGLDRYYWANLKFGKLDSIPKTHLLFFLGLLVLVSFPGERDRKTVIGLIPKPVRIIMAPHLGPVLSFLCETHAQQGIFTHWLGVTEISQISKPHRINLNTWQGHNKPMAPILLKTFQGE